MLTVRNAKPLLALTTLFIPWDFFMFGSGIGWGLHFPLFRFVRTNFGTQFNTIVRMYELSSQLTGSGRLGIVVWLLAGVLAALAVVYALISRAMEGTVPPKEGRQIGLAFVGAGALFFLSRFLVYDFFLVSGSQKPNWFSIPIGAAYTIFVGVLFYRNRF